MSEPANGGGGGQAGGAAAPAAGAGAAAGGAAAGAAPAAGIIGNGAPNEFLNSLPEEFRGDPSLKDIKDIAGLTKGFVHAQKLVGADKIVLPKEGAPDAEWEPLYARLGRPEKPDGYKFSDVKFPEGVQLNEALQTKFGPTFHKLGLNNKQADGLRSELIQHQIAEIQTGIDRRNEEVSKGEAALKQKWGDKYEANVKHAEVALARFATPELMKALHTSGLGSHPGIVEAFSEIGLRMSEDTARGKGQGDGGQLTGAEAGKAEVTRLSKDGDFQKILHDKFHKDHADALKKWEAAHKAAVA